MPVPVDFVLSRRDLVPPVYLAGSFSQWQANLLMEFTSKTEDQQTWNEFHKTVELEPGVYQYKFRLGDGDWWITDDTHEQATDASGNVNNVIDVKEPKRPESEQPIKLQVQESINQQVIEPVKESIKELKRDEPITTTKNDIATDGKLSIPSSIKSEAILEDTINSSNDTAVETSSLLKNRTITNDQSETYGSVTSLNHDRPAEAATTNGILADGPHSRLPSGANAKSKPGSQNIFRRFFCFCSSTTGLSLAGVGTVLVAAYVLQAQIN